MGMYGGTIINQSPISAFSQGDNLAVYVPNQADTRRGSISLLQEYMQENLDFSTTSAFPQYTTQYAAPASNGFNIALSAVTENSWLILTPTGTLSSGTITLPLFSGCIDKQEVLVNSTQQVTSLAIASNGATSIIGAPSTLSANAFFRLRLDKATQNWYRVG
jgi:hypothetical protein